MGYIERAYEEVERGDRAHIIGVDLQKESRSSKPIEKMHSFLTTFTTSEEKCTI